MKKLLKNLSLLCLTVLIGFMFSSVNAKAARANGTTSIEVSEYSNYPSFYVHTDNNWTVTVDPGSEFITPLNPTGTKGDAIIVLKIDQNPSTSTRYGYVRVNDGNGVVTLYITQKGKSDGYFRIVKTPFTNGSANVGSGETELLFTCESNKYVSVLLDGKTVRLIKKSPDESNGTRFEYGLPISANESTNEVVHKLVIRVDGNNIVGGNYHTFTIKQKGKEKQEAPKKLDVSVSFYGYYYGDTLYVYCVNKKRNPNYRRFSITSTFSVSTRNPGSFVAMFFDINQDFVVVSAYDGSNAVHYVSEGKAGMGDVALPLTLDPFWGQKAHFFIVSKAAYNQYKGNLRYYNGSLGLAAPINASLDYIPICTLQGENAANFYPFEWSTRERIR